MASTLSRRSFIAAASVAGLTPCLAAGGETAASFGSDVDPDSFPRQPLDEVQAVVGASHRDLEKVRELVTARPALATAAWDWGFGDWESALGAASHTGRREIALLLMEHGARPDIFTFAMLGDVGAVRAMVEARPGVQRILGPHGIPLLRHAQAGGDAAAEVVKYLESLGDAGREYDKGSLSEADLRAYEGQYACEEPRMRFIVEQKRGGLTLTREPQSARNLLSLGEHRFHPAGAAHVRLEFEMKDGRGIAIVIRDGPQTLRAVRA